MNDWKTYNIRYRTFEVSPNGKVFNEKGDLVTGSMHRNGFRVIHLRLFDNGKVIYKSLIVHRVVAESYIENSDNKPYVIHKDGDLLNNEAENLQWATLKEKIKHQQDLGRHAPHRILNSEKVAQIKQKLLGDKSTIADLAAQYGVSHTQIIRIKKNENWVSVPTPSV